MFDFDIANHVAGLVISIGAALGGLWKFADWLRERPSKTKLEAARALAQWNRDVPESLTIRSFGEREVLRLHFKDLTGIDRRDDHAALLRAHAKLGGTDFDWGRLKRIAAYLEPSGDDIVVRELRRGDYVLTALSVLLVLMCLASGIFFVAGMAEIANTDKGTIAGRLIASLVLGIFATSALVIAWLFLLFLINTFGTAPDIRKKLAAPDARKSSED